MKNEYAFIAVFEYADDGINISFPDLPGCLSCAEVNNTEESVKNAKEALGLYLFGMEQDGEPIPESTPLSKIELEKNVNCSKIFQDALKNFLGVEEPRTVYTTGIA